MFLSLIYQTKQKTKHMTQTIYHVQDRQAGNKIDQYDSRAEALMAIRQFEAYDQSEGIFEPNFYEIVEETFVPAYFFTDSFEEEC